LLGPVAAAGEHQRVAQRVDEVFEIGPQLVHAGKGDHQVTIARNVERRDLHRRAGVGRRQLPVAVDIAIPIKGAAKAGALKLARVEVNITPLGELSNDIHQ
jgi:hypothetical protein